MITASREEDLTTKQEGNTVDGKNNSKASCSSKTPWSKLNNPQIVRVSRAFGGKDRHSKVCTVRGLRDRRETSNFGLQEINDDINMKVKKYLRGEGANVEGLRDKKLKGQLAIREELYGKSAKAAAKAEKVRVLCEKAKGILMEESNGSSQSAILGEATINLLIMLMH